MKLSFALIAIAAAQDVYTTADASTTAQPTQQPERPQWYPYESVSRINKLFFTKEYSFSSLMSYIYSGRSQARS
jgi:hypothetical protein